MTMEDEFNGVTARVIMNADDYGVSKFLNEAILEGIRKGVVNSVSVMVTHQYLNKFEEDIIELLSAINFAEANYSHKVGIGLHLSLNSGMPISEPSLIKRLLDKDNIYFKDFKNINIGKEYCEQAYKEMESQYNLLSNAIGEDREVDHIDHHLGFVSFFSVLWKTYVQFSKDYSLAIRSPQGYMGEGDTYYNDGRVSGVKEEALRTLRARTGFGRFRRRRNRYTIRSIIQFGSKRNKVTGWRYKYAVAEGAKVPVSYNDNYYKQATVVKAMNFLESFDDMECKEFMLHLGHDENMTSADINAIPHGFRKDSFAKRHRELNGLLNPKVRNFILGNSTLPVRCKQYRVKLTNYSEL
jgi:predicted glycoside hydrolase/deacetylase ChbG (UPF0249 family)